MQQFKFLEFFKHLCNFNMINVSVQRRNHDSKKCVGIFIRGCEIFLVKFLNQPSLCQGLPSS